MDIKVEPVLDVKIEPIDLKVEPVDDNETQVDSQLKRKASDIDTGRLTHTRRDAGYDAHYTC